VKPSKDVIGKIQQNMLIEYESVLTR